MKIAVTGKGGVGKTSFAGALARCYAAEGCKVLAVDADPDANLGAALGFPQSVLSGISPLSDMKDIIAQRTEAMPGLVGQMFKLNPKVDDLPERFCIEHRGVKLLTMGTVKQGGAGCICPEHAFLRALMQHIILGKNEALIIDMEAGIEHFGRATADAVDAFVVVVEPGKRSIKTLKAIQKLAEDIGVSRIFAVGNKVRSDEDRRFIQEACDGIPVLGYLSYNPELVEIDRRELSPFDNCREFTNEVKLVKMALEGHLK